MIPNAPSEAAAAMILRFEIGSESDYSEHPTWPGGGSGVTIGIGYDLGYSTPNRIAADWGALDRPTVIRLAACAGNKGAAAKASLYYVSDAVIPYDVAVAVYRFCDLPLYANLTATAFPNSAELPADSFGALVSLVMNRGCSMTDSAFYPNNRLEMRQIRDACVARNFATVPGLIRAMTRLWPAGFAGLVERRNAEADLFEQGLGESEADRLNAAELAAIHKGS